MTILEIASLLLAVFILGRWSKRSVILHDTAHLTNCCPFKLQPSPDAEEFATDDEAELDWADQAAQLRQTQFQMYGNDGGSINDERVAMFVKGIGAE